MKEDFQVAIVGCGWAGTRHANAYTRCGAKIRWTVDLDRKRGEKLGVEYNANVSTDYRSALNDPEVNVVDICLPHSLHAPVAVDAASAGKHVLCEKPLADSLEAADRMIETANRVGIVLMVAENIRFNSVYLKIKDLLQHGVIGQPALIQMTRECYLRKSFLEERQWFLDKKSAAGGIMTSGGIHDFETMRMLIGEVESVYSLRARQRFMEMEGDDTSVALVRFYNGAVGTLVESFIMKSLVTASGPEIHTLRIDGDLGSLSTNDGQTIVLFSEREDFLPGGILKQHEINVPGGDTFILEVEHFLECIQTGEEPITSGRSQRRSLEIVLAAYQSMESGKPVTLT
jgi:UDP-N-acetylglucosamine 3-dehydrogenase